MEGVGHAPALGERGLGRQSDNDREERHDRAGGQRTNGAGRSGDEPNPARIISDHDHRGTSALARSSKTYIRLFNMSATDHCGLNYKAFVMTQVVGGKWKIVHIF